MLPHSVSYMMLCEAGKRDTLSMKLVHSSRCAFLTPNPPGTKLRDEPSYE